MRSVLQGRSRFESSQLTLDYMLGGPAEGKHLVEGFGEALEFILRIVGRHEVVDDIDQTLHLHVCSETPHSVCGQVVFKLVLLVRMHEETVINQETQDHA